MTGVRRKRLLGQLAAMESVLYGRQLKYLHKTIRLLQGQHMADIAEVLGWLEGMVRLRSGCEDGDFFAEVLSAVEEVECYGQQQAV